MSLGPAEILVILVVALLVFGPQRLPEVGRQVGAAMRELRKMQDTVRGELDMVLHPEHGTAHAPTCRDEPGDHTDDRRRRRDRRTRRPRRRLSDRTPPTPTPATTRARRRSDEDRRFLGPPDSFI